MMKLLLRLAFLGLLLCLHAHGWALKRDTQNEHWRELAQLQNEHWKELAQPQIRELFLKALHEYFSAKGIQVNRTAPAFVLTSRDRDTETHGMQKEQETVVLDPEMHN